MDDIEELLGGSTAPEPKRRRGRPTREEAAKAAKRRLARLEEERAEREAKKLLEQAARETKKKLGNAAAGRTAIEERQFHLPVTKKFLADVLGIDPMTVTRRLRRVEPDAYSGSGDTKRPLYEFRRVLPFLIKSEMDTVTLLETMNPADLPPQVNKTVWEAKRIRLKYELEAGQAWSSEDVLETFGKVFMTIKERSKLWSDQIKEQCKGKTPSEIFGAFDQHVDAFLSALHSDLIDIPNRRKTESILVRDMPAKDAPDFDDDEEYDMDELL